MAESKPMLTPRALEAQLHAAGLREGHTVLMHSALKSLNVWIPGSTQSIIEALLNVLGTSGTLMMPAHTPNNTDPAFWQHPPVPSEWWPLIREQSAAFDPARTPCYDMGILAEYFRTFPDVRRSTHPTVSFCAWGRHAQTLTEGHNLHDHLGEPSPIGKLYALDGYVLLFGTGHDHNTSLHLAEYRAHWPSKRRKPEGSAMMVNGVRQWIEYDTLDEDTDDFITVGTAYEQSIGYEPARVGDAQVRYLRQRPLVDFATAWMNQHRT